jgi:hypothetical protein
MGLVVGVIRNAIKEELAEKGVTLKDLRDLLKKSKARPLCTKCTPRRPIKPISVLASFKVT